MTWLWLFQSIFKNFIYFPQNFKDFKGLWETLACGNACNEQICECRKCHYLPMRSDCRLWGNWTVSTDLYREGWVCEHMSVCLSLGTYCVPLCVCSGQWCTVHGVVAWQCLCPCAGEVVRGDSMQSDSSGYADEEFSPSSNTHIRWQKTQNCVNNVKKLCFLNCGFFFALKIWVDVMDWKRLKFFFIRKVKNMQFLPRAHTENRVL